MATTRKTVKIKSALSILILMMRVGLCMDQYLDQLCVFWLKLRLFYRAILTGCFKTVSSITIELKKK